MRIRKNHWKLAFTAAVVIAFLASAFASVSLSGLAEESSYSSPTTTTIFSDAIPPDPNEGSGNPNGIHQAVFPQVASGDEYLCAAAEDRTVWCWGLNHFGQLGNGTYTDSNTPTQVPGIATATQISAGNDHTCTRLEDGTIRCWGSNFTGQLGNNTTTRSNTPVQVSGITTAVQVSAGFDHTCAVLADGTIRCWGRNQNGQLGNGSHTRSTTPARVSGITTGVQVSSGYYHTCAVLEDGTVQCWGRNHHGQSGQSDVIDTNTPNSVPQVHRATQVSVGLFHTCAVLEDGTVSCWGENAFGQLGNGVQEAIDSDDRPDTTQAPTARTYTSHNPLLVGGINTATRISAGDDHTCAVLADETVRCWGSNFGGQLGNGDPIAHSDTPVQAWGIATATQISAGNNYSCAVTEDRTIKCWGNNNPRAGKPGDGTIIGSTPPSSIFWIIPSPPGTANPQIQHQKISAGASHTCALIINGTIYCWGNNNDGQLGNATYTDSNIPSLVSGIDNAVSISAGYAHTCALLEDGTIKCWGRNYYGQLGNGATYRANSNVPVSVSGINNAVSISYGITELSSSCAILEDGTVKCWGYNNSDLLGGGKYVGATTSSTPVLVPGITGAVQASIGKFHACFLIEDGTVQCTGNINRWQSGSQILRADDSIVTPVQIPGITTAIQISVGYSHTCAMLEDGTSRCWGLNTFGQLGDGSTTNSRSIVEVEGIDTTASISAAAGNAHTCAVLEDGTAKCWGRNNNGQLGNAANKNSSIPVTVSGINTVAQISTGLDHTCAVLEDNVVWCWGKNTFGQLGDGTAVNSNIPLLILASFAAPADPLPQIRHQKISAGYGNTCAVLEDGRVKCWGNNLNGQLGYGTNTESTTPVLVSGINNAVAVSVGIISTCALLEDGRVKCWGSNILGQLGDGTNILEIWEQAGDGARVIPEGIYPEYNGIPPINITSHTPVLVSGINNAVAISSGSERSSTCAILADGTVKCWGLLTHKLSKRFSFYHIISEELRAAVNPTPVTVPGITGAVQVSIGSLHICFLIKDGTVKCQGDNQRSQLGRISGKRSDTPVSILGLVQATQISAGVDHTCALRTDGTIRCWGDNSRGQLGNSSTTNSHDPVEVTGINTATRLSTAVGYSHTCAVLEDGTIKCWGFGGYGSLGNGSDRRSTYPVSVSGITTASQVSAGRHHTCALLEDKTNWCWGWNNNGQLGDGTVTQSNIPVLVLGVVPPANPLPQIRHQKISAAQHHSCAVLEDGTIKCWGGNYNGQLGNGTDSATTHPVFVSGINNAIAVSTGTGFTCALLEDKTVKCWGSNTVGQLGDGTNILEQVEDGVRVSATYIDPPTAVQVPIASHTPVLVSGINNAVGISAGAGRASTCAILEDGTVKCWGSTSNTHTGSNSFGQNSESLRADIQITPVVVPEITGAVEVSIGVHHICFLIEDGTVKCQGDNRFSQLGYESRYRSATPVLIPEITTATQISAGSRHNCALLADRTIKCWGYNYGGRLGNGSDDFKSHIPVEVTGINTATYISTAAGNHTCAVLADGTIKCWGGFGLDGKLGNGTRTDGRIPVLVSGITTGSQVSAGTFHTCALLEDKTNWCWGHNYYGQLGDGTVSGSNIPVLVLEPLSPSLSHKVSAAFQHTCLLLESGRIQCWGSGGNGQLGNGRNSNSRTPVSVIGIDNAVDIYTGGDHNCALLADGTIKCWGWNFVGQLGNGTNFSSNLPVSVVGIDNAVALSTGVGRDATCAILEDGTVKCWGRNAHGLVKDAGEVYHHSQGVEIPYSSTPVPVPGINTAVQVEIGRNTACILLEDGTIRCLGRNYYGYLWPSSGNEANRFSPFASTPVQVPGITGVAQISIGGYRICVLLNNGTIKCWGNANYKGGIGPTSGGTSFRNPLETEGISTATMFGTGTAHSCALLENGTIKCWGRNSAFQGHELGHLGDGSGEDSLTTPVLVSGITTATQISVGKPHTCAILEDKTVWCWGPNWAGQLGNGESSRGGKKANSLTPTMVIGAGQIS